MLEIPTVSKQAGLTPRITRPECDPRGRQTELGSKPADRLSAAFGTLAVAVVAIGLVLAATTALQERAAALTAGQSAAPVPVWTQRLERVGSYTVPRDFVGQVEAAQSTHIAFELPGRVMEVMVDEAAVVSKGDVLARLDTRLLENRRTTQMAVRKALEARVELSRLTMGRRNTLNQRGFMANQLLDQTRLGLAELRAMIAETDSSVAGIDIEIEKATIRAPFDGEIGDRFIDVGATVSAGQPVLTILQRVAPQMRVGLSDEMAESLSVGDVVTARIGSASFPASLSRLRADIDPRTRTRTAIFDLQLDDGAAAPLYGQTGTIALTQTIRQDGAWVPVTALQEGTRGLWTVLTVRSTDKAAYGTAAAEAVEILYADQQRAFVRGTFPDKALFVASGPHRVTSSQAVRINDGAH